MPDFSRIAVEGFELLQAGRGDEASDRFERGLQQDPKDQGCLLGLMRLHVLAHELESAVPYAERLLAIVPNHPEAKSHRALHAFDNGEQAALSVLDMLSNAPNSGVFERLNHARALSSLGKGDAADAAFGRAIALEPQNALPYLEAADAALDRGDARVAIHRLMEATRISPNEPALWVALAEAHEATGATGPALEAVDSAIGLAPQEPELLEVRYDVAARANDWPEAISSAERLVKLAPNELQYQFQLGEALTFDGQLDRAEEILNAVVKKDPTAPEPLRALAEVFSERGEHEHAIELLKKAVALEPTAVGAANDLANLYFEEPDGMRQAVALLRPVLAANPDDAITAFNLALALSKDDPQEAMKHARSVAESGHEELAPEARRLMKALAK